jgi:acyl-CoA thioester hydrolase
VPPVSSPFVHRLRVRYGECDPQGIVFNANYLHFFDIALTELWREAVDGGYKRMTQEGIDLVVAEARCRYVSSAGFDDELDVGMTIGHLGTTSVRTDIVIDRGDERVVEGELRHVVVSLATRAKTPIPEWLRSALEPYVS